MQDAPTYDDESTTCRLLTMTQGPGAVLRNPPADDTRLLAEYLSASRLFGDGTAVGVNGSPYQVEGAPDELWRMDYRTAFGSEDTEDHDHVFVPQDKGKPEIAVIGLTGPGITEDILTTFTAPLPPSAPDPAHRLDHRCRRLPGPARTHQSDRPHFSQHRRRKQHLPHCHRARPDGDRPRRRLDHAPRPGGRPRAHSRLRPAGTSPRHRLGRLDPARLRPTTRLLRHHVPRYRSRRRPPRGPADLAHPPPAQEQRPRRLNPRRLADHCPRRPTAVGALRPSIRKTAIHTGRSSPCPSCQPCPPPHYHRSRRGQGDRRPLIQHRTADARS